MSTSSGIMFFMPCRIKSSAEQQHQQMFEDTSSASLTKGQSTWVTIDSLTGHHHTPTHRPEKLMTMQRKTFVPHCPCWVFMWETFIVIICRDYICGFQTYNRKPFFVRNIWCLLIWSRLWFPDGSTLKEELRLANVTQHQTTTWARRKTARGTASPVLPVTFQMIYKLKPTL